MLTISIDKIILLKCLNVQSAAAKTKLDIDTPKRFIVQCIEQEYNATDTLN